MKNDVKNEGREPETAQCHPPAPETDPPHDPSPSLPLLDDMFEQSPVPTWISDRSGTLVKINRACTELLNITPQEVIGKYNVLNDNIVKEQGVLPLVERVFREGATARFEIRYDSAALEHLRLAQHAFVVLDVTIFPIRDRQGRVTNAVIQHNDVTSQRLAEEALQRTNLDLEARVRERTADLLAVNEALRKEIDERTLAEQELLRSEQRYRLLFNQMLNGFALHETVGPDREGVAEFRVLDINPALERMTGTQRQRVVGRKLKELLPAEETIWAEMYSRVAHSGEPLSFHVDSASLGRHFDVSAFSPRQGQVAAIFKDVTERFLMEKALREREELFRTLCAAVPIGIFMANPQGASIYHNPWLQELCGLSEEELLGWGWEVAVHPEDREATAAKWQQTVAAGAIYRHECRLVRHGEAVWIRALARPFSGPDGPGAGYVGIVEDITEQRHAREELLKTQKLESLGVLAGGIAHDFNNLLSIILGYISLARSRTDEPETVLAHLKQSENGVLRARELTQQLLTFARGGDPVKKILDLNELLRESARFGALGTNVVCDFTLAGERLIVSADEGQLSQVVHNLVINAIQAMPGGGTISIGSWRSSSAAGEELVHFSVRDTGVGIPGPVQAKIFDPYFSTKQGSGLGLTSCYSIVKRHGGNLEVQSAVGQGSTFTVTLPAYRQQATPEPARNVPESRGSGRILMMDDDPLIREVGQAMLEQLGYRAVCVPEGGAVLAAYRKGREEGDPFDAVVMDLTVRGGVGGKEAIGALVALDPAVKAVVSSGYSEDPVLAQHRAYGFRAVLVKPYSKEELSQVLHDLLKPRARGDLDGG